MMGCGPKIFSEQRDYPRPIRKAQGQRPFTDWSAGFNVCYPYPWLTAFSVEGSQGRAQARGFLVV